MTLIEVGNLLDKIKLYRPYFAGHLDKTGLTRLKQEWFEKLEPYDSEDINEKLDEFLKDGDNLSKQPDVYQLIKHCKTIKDKKNFCGYTTSCKFCGRWFDMNEVHDHEDRCRSIKYIGKLYSKFFPERELPLKDLYNMSKQEFDVNYEKILDVIYPKLEGKEKDDMKNVIESRHGERRFDLKR